MFCLKPGREAGVSAGKYCVGLPDLQILEQSPVSHCPRATAGVSGRPLQMVCSPHLAQGAELWQQKWVKGEPRGSSRDAG